METAIGQMDSLQIISKADNSQAEGVLEGVINPSLHFRVRPQGHLPLVETRSIDLKQKTKTIYIETCNIICSVIKIAMLWSVISNFF